jgi:hypothetical protein
METEHMLTKDLIYFALVRKLLKKIALHIKQYSQ